MTGIPFVRAYTVSTTLYPVASTAIARRFGQASITARVSGVLFVTAISAVPMRSAISGDSA